MAAGDGETPGASGDDGAGADGVGGDAAGSDGASDDPAQREAPTGPVLCEPDLASGATPLKRLSRRQYENTLDDLFGDAVVQSVSDELAQLPLDGEQEASFTSMDGRVSQRHVESYYGVASGLASQLAGDAARLNSLVGDCVDSAPLGDACLRGFVERFGRDVYRRPLSSEEVDRYLELNDPAQSNDEIIRSVLFTMLMSPQFLYHLEIEGTPMGGEEHLQLSAYELASRLSYHFWQTMPDEELFAAADSGELMTEAGYAAQVERLFGDPRTRQTLWRFFEDWFHLDVFGGFATTPAFEAFVQGVEANDALYEAAVQEIRALTDHYIWDNDGTWDDLLTTDRVFAQSPALAELYGVAPWDGSSAPASFAPGERAGLLTRAAMLISSNESTNPFRRGAHLLRDVLCTPISPPPADQFPAGTLVPPPFDPTQSTRERFEQKTAAAECQACHARFNPFGFALEAYDALGRFRTEEAMYDDEGTLVGSVPVDSSATVQLGEQVEVSGPAELSQVLSDSGLTHECFARHYFRYTYRRVERRADGCQLESLVQSLESGASLRETLREIALRPEFRERIVD